MYGLHSLSVQSLCTVSNPPYSNQLGAIGFSHLPRLHDLHERVDCRVVVVVLQSVHTAAGGGPDSVSGGLGDGCTQRLFADGR